MTNEMRRSCVITHPVVVNGGKPFEALWASVDWCTIDECLYLVTRRSDGFIAKRFRLQLGGFKESLPIRDSIRWQLAKALNPPIKVTQAVLDEMEKVPEAKFWVWDDESKYLLEWQGVWEYESKNDSWQNGRDFDDEGIPSHSKLQLGDYIQADCPLALQVLLQFNTEGELFDA